uniref:Beta-(1,2)-xylosyltransferase n=1 Tax=Tanacetum cinerariifolium TaxID=118510 RepID=A0A6L2KM71_TANCI|nr:beta-(1,2)-xylosyltransferase [Tanacetum cinerariifolium]
MLNRGKVLESVIGKGEDEELPLFAFGAFDFQVGSVVSKKNDKLADEAFLNEYLKNGILYESSTVPVVGDVSSQGAFYLIAGATAVMPLGTTFSILFSCRAFCEALGQMEYSQTSSAMVSSSKCAGNSKAMNMFERSSQSVNKPLRATESLRLEVESGDVLRCFKNQVTSPTSK